MVPTTVSLVLVLLILCLYSNWINIRGMFLWQKLHIYPCTRGTSSSPEETLISLIRSWRRVHPVNEAGRQSPIVHSNRFGHMIPVFTYFVKTNYSQSVTRDPIQWIKVGHVLHVVARRSDPKQIQQNSMRTDWIRWNHLTEAVFFSFASFQPGLTRFLCSLI